MSSAKPLNAMDFYEIENAFGRTRPDVRADAATASDDAVSKFRSAEISVYGWLRKLGQFWAVGVDNGTSKKKSKELA